MNEEETKQYEQDSEMADFALCVTGNLCNAQASVKNKAEDVIVAFLEKYPMNPVAKENIND